MLEPGAKPLNLTWAGFYICISIYCSNVPSKTLLLIIVPYIFYGNFSLLKDKWNPFEALADEWVVLFTLCCVL